jgi:hypothetical protein
MAVMRVVATNNWIGLIQAWKSLPRVYDLHKVCVFRADDEPIFDVHASGT